MVDHEYWSRVDFQAEALSLCSKFDTAFVGQSTYADPCWLIRTYDVLAGSPYADRLSTAVAGLLDHADADVRVVAAHFFTLWPLAAGSSRVLDIIENGPSHRVERGDGVLIPTYVPHLIVDCFAKTLATMAASGNQRAVALNGRTALSELLKRTDT